ncbi:MAG: GNAT family protein [Oscillospiraceae bacterium]
MIKLGTKELDTSRLILRKFRNIDYIAMFNNWAKLEECTKYFPWNPATDIEMIKIRVESWVSNYEDLFFQWGIELKETQELVGAINLHNVDATCNSAETSYILAPKYWNNGFMTEALSRVLKYAFKELELNRVCADYFLPNEASARVLKKNHMSYEGTSREKYYKNGEYIDSVQYAILKSDWLKSNN